MFEDERQRVSHRRGAIARDVAKRGLVAFLAFAMAFGTTPAQLWAEGAEGIAEAVAQAATPGEVAALAGGAAEQSGTEVPLQQRQQLATKARRRGRALPRASSLRRHPLAKQDLPPRLPSRQRTRQKPAMSPRSRSRSRSRLSAPMPTARLRPGWHPRSSSSTRARRFYLKSITSPSDGRTLAFDPTTYAFWQLFVDGASSSVGASSVKLTQGQKIEFAYTAGSSSPVVKDQVAANVTVIGRDAQGKTQTWVDNAQYVVRT